MAGKTCAGGVTLTDSPDGTATIIGVPGAWPMGTVALSVCMFARAVSVPCKGSAAAESIGASQIRIRRCPNIHQRSPTTIVRRPINTPFGAHLRALDRAAPLRGTRLTYPPAIPSQLCCGSSAADLVDEPKTTRTASEM